MAEIQGSVDPLASKEHIGHPMKVNFYKLGGTWDMIEREREDGTKARVGTGNLGDDEVREVQEQVGLFSATTREAREKANKNLAQELHRRFQTTQPESVDTAEHLASWCHNEAGESFGNFATGPFTPLFSGDSSHLHTPIIAPMVATLIDKVKEDPTKPIIGGQGTDTADIAVLSLYDTLTFDTQLPPLVLTGANTPHESPGSDAPQNFIDLAKVVHAGLDPGAYWVFHGYLYSAADFVKIDPQETRKVEDQSTFVAAQRTSQPINRLLKLAREADWQKCHVPSPEHIINKISMEKLYDALNSVYVFDLGNQNQGWMDMERVIDPSVKAVIVAAHSLGNTDNETRTDLVNAAKAGKIVIDVSRALIGATDESYEASLLGANHDPKELGGTGNRIIGAHKLNKTMARALVTRAVMEGLDQKGAQRLFDTYARSREMV